jgi:hypothetical protein
MPVYIKQLLCNDKAQLHVHFPPKVQVFPNNHKHIFNVSIRTERSLEDVERVYFVLNKVSTAFSEYAGKNDKDQLNTNFCNV